MTDGAPRSWPRALGLAALTLWLPALVPFWLGPLGECMHCVQTYALFLPLVPAIVVAIVLGVELIGLFVAGAVVASMLGGLTVLLRRASVRTGAIVQTAVILLVAAEALAFSFALRA